MQHLVMMENGVGYFMTLTVVLVVPVMMYFQLSTLWFGPIKQANILKHTQN